MSLLSQAGEFIHLAIQAVTPARCIPDSVRIESTDLVIGQSSFPMDRYDGIYVIGFGKASAAMAVETEKILGDRLKEGMVITRYGHALPTRKILILEASHPIPDENTLLATGQLIRFVQSIPERALVLILISGGGSALLESLPAGISLEDLQQTFRLLLHSGANIREMNTVRKHLSTVKGGQLARLLYPRPHISLIISDVIGDPLEYIASGPTYPDPTSFRDAWFVVEKYRIAEKLPGSVLKFLKKGFHGEIPDTPKAGDVFFEHAYYEIIANNFRAVRLLETLCREAGYHPLLLTHRMEGEARGIGKVLAALVWSVKEKSIPVHPPAAILFGGESTVTVTGSGLGGRCQEMATALLANLRGFDGEFAFIACGTDGMDGPTDAAGGAVSFHHLCTMEEKRLNPFDYLANNNCYYFLQQIDGLFKTGPTGTNVMDLHILLIR